MNQQATEAVAAIAQTLTTVIVVLIAAPFGITMAAAAISGRPFAMLALPVALLKRKCGLSPRVLLGPQLPALTAALLMGAGVWLLRVQIEPLFGSALVLAILVAAGAGLYVLMIAILMPTFAAQFIRRSPAPD
jgi:hypothetical protein